MADVMTLEDMREEVFSRYTDDNSENGANGTPAEAEDGAANDVQLETRPEQVLPEGQPETTPVEETPATEPSTQQNNSPSYEEIMNTAALRDENTRLANELERVTAQLAEAQNAAKQNAIAANTAVAQVADNGGIPELNLDEFAYASDEERARMIAEHNNALIAFAANQATADVLGKIQPLMKQYDLSVEEREMSAFMDKLCEVEGFSDVKDHYNDIKELSKREEFAKLPVSQRMLIAAFIDKGVRASQPVPAQSEPDINAQADAILANPELMKIIAQKQTADIKARNDGVPTHTAGGGFGNAAFVKSERPMTIEEAREKYNIY